MYTSPYPDVDIPESPITPYVLRRTGELGDKPALIDGPSGRTLSYGGLAPRDGGEGCGGEHCHVS